MRIVRLLAALVLAAALAHAAQGELRVRYRTADTVYLNGGRAAGIAEGTRLNVVVSGAVVAELEVTFVAEHSASCRVVSERAPIIPGQRVVRLGAPPPPDAPATPRPPEPPPPGENGAYGARPWGRASGGVSVGWMRLWDRTPLPESTGLLGTPVPSVPRDFQERTARFDLDVRELAGQPFGFRLRARLRDDERDGVSGTSLPASARDDRLHEAAVRYEPPSGRMRAEAGRLGGAFPFSIGVLDGAMAELRVARALSVGGVAGRGADAGWLASGSSATRYGAFLRASAGRGALNQALVLLLHDGDRDRAAFESSLRAGGVRFLERVQIERFQGTTRVTDVFATLGYRASSSATLSVSYDRQRTVVLTDEAAALDRALREALRQGLRASIEVQGPGSLGVYASGGLRSQEAGVGSAWNVSGGLRHPHLGGLSASADASYYVNGFTHGVLATARAGRVVYHRHSIDMSYVFSTSSARIPAAGPWRTQQWLRLYGRGALGRQAFVRLDLEYAHGDDLQGPRVGLETGYRF